MTVPSSAAFKPGTPPNLNANIVNLKSFAVSGTHDSVITTITTTATITGITAPQYLINNRTGEIIYAEGISGATFTSCTRNADGSTAAGMNTGDILYPVIAANLYNQLVREILAIAPYVYNADPVALQQMASEQALRFQKPDSQVEHGNLNGLSDDDHAQYHTDARGDARYHTKGESAALTNALRMNKPDEQIRHDNLAEINSANYTHLTSANHTDLTDGGATTLHKHDHGGMDGLADDDHTQYIKHALSTAGNDFLVGSGSNTYIKKTLAETLTILGKAAASGLASLDTSSLVVQNPANATATPTGSKIPISDVGGTLNSGWIPDLSATYAVAAKGVTNGDSHDHAGGDGAQIDHGGLGGLGDDDHTQYIKHALSTASNDFLIGSGSNTYIKKTLAETLTILGKAAASGLASLDGSSLVVQNPANATATPTAGKIPIADGSGKLDSWITPGSYTLTASDILMTQIFS